MNASYAQHLRELQGFFADSAVCRESFHLLVHLATRLAAAGHAENVLAAVQTSPEASMFGSLADGLRLHLGLEVSAEGEGYQLARQIAERICEDVAA